MTTIIEENCCTECGTELEPSQVGLCEDCDEHRPRPFSELSEEAKEHARKEYTSGDYPGYDWWDYTYEDAVRMAKILGIEISTTAYTTSRGETYHTPDISFSGFCSQGDGACFEGSYSFNPGCVKEIISETNNAELICIATELYTMQLARRMQGLEYFSASISTSGRYSHSGTMSVTVNIEDDEDNELGIQNLENEVTQLMRGFADWIYKQLESENDWHYSDEYVDERLNESDMAFDADGSEI